MRYFKTIRFFQFFPVLLCIFGCTSNIDHSVIEKNCEINNIENTILLPPTNRKSFSSKFCLEIQSFINHTNIHSILINYRGKTELEIYKEGKDNPISKFYGLRFPWDGNTKFDENSLHDIRSASKSIVSILYGIALDKEIVPKLESPVLLSFPDSDLGMYDSENKNKQSITWNHLLTMSSGLKWNEWGTSYFTNDEIGLYFEKDIFRYVFERPSEFKPGIRFNYNGGSTAILAEILTKNSNQSLDELLLEWLFKPMGITKFEWVKDKQGRPLSFSGLRLRPRDMLKIGELILHEGRWNQKQLVSKKWIQDSTNIQIQTNIRMLTGDGGSIDYGKHWWVGSSTIREKSFRWISALGNGGQRIYIVPELKLVVVTTAGEYNTSEIGQKIGRLFNQILEEYR
ncbi:serine hydrolase [Leptospira sp. 96542]|nr:serine hydrolase [Leptospira sp. 96542]